MLVPYRPLAQLFHNFFRTAIKAAVSARCIEERANNHPLHYAASPRDGHPRVRACRVRRAPAARRIDARLTLVAAVIATAHAITAPVDYVNLLAGSFTRGDVFSTGNTLPPAGRPWGFNHWASRRTTADRRGGSMVMIMSLNGYDVHPSTEPVDRGLWLVYDCPQMGGFAANPTGFFEPRAATVLPHVLISGRRPMG